MFFASSENIPGFSTILDLGAFCNSHRRKLVLGEVPRSTGHTHISHFVLDVLFIAVGKDVAIFNS
jgi:hypothetical protein